MLGDGSGACRSTGRVGPRGAPARWGVVPRVELTRARQDGVLDEACELPDSPPIRRSEFWRPAWHAHREERHTQPSRPIATLPRPFASSLFLRAGAALARGLTDIGRGEARGRTIRGGEERTSVYRQQSLILACHGKTAQRGDTAQRICELPFVPQCTFFFARFKSAGAAPRFDSFSLLSACCPYNCSIGRYRLRAGRSQCTC